MRIKSKAALLAAFGLGALAASVFPPLAQRARDGRRVEAPALRVETVRYQPPPPAYAPPPVEQSPKPDPPPVDPSDVLAPLPIGALAEAPIPAGAATAAGSADPEGAAQQYVEKTRAEAKAAAESLRNEANTLRERLKRVEAALNRWESLLSALDLNHGPATPPGPITREPGLAQPAELVPAPPPAAEPALAPPPAGAAPEPR